MSEFHEYLDKRYALALYEIAEEKGKTQEYVDELTQVVKVIDENIDLVQLLNHPDISTSKKKELFESIFKDKIEADILSFLLLLIEKNRVLEMDGIIEEIKNIHLEHNRSITAYVKTFIPLTEKERVALIANLEKKFNKTIVLNEEVDKAIIGGVFVKVGNVIMDGTIRSKYEAMRRLTLKTE